MLELDNVTLVTIDGKGDNINALKALKYSSSNIKFKEVKYLSPNNLGDDSFYKFVKINQLNYDQYNEFCVKFLDEYVETEHFIIVQDDGFILHPQHWSNSFLDFDYIGAPWDVTDLFYNSYRWPKIHEKFEESNLQYHIGNGGFSLRSKKLLKNIKNVIADYYINEPEDVFITIFLRKELESKGCRFADFNTAKMFSCETQNVNGHHFSPEESFGFHGRDTHRRFVDILNNVSI